jgi:hypothetical protein
VRSLRTSVLLSVYPCRVLALTCLAYTAFKKAAFWQEEKNRECKKDTALRFARRRYRTPHSDVPIANKGKKNRYAVV